MSILKIGDGIVRMGGGGTAEYSAGKNIDITNNVISVTGLTAYQPSSSMTAYQQSSAMTAYQSTASMTGYATTADLTGKQDVTAMTGYQPTITYGYNGDSAITSIDGSSLAGSGGGDNNLFIAHATAGSPDSTPYSAVWDAYTAGKTILLQYNDGHEESGNGTILNLSLTNPYVTADDHCCVFLFQAFSANGQYYTDVPEPIMGTIGLHPVDNPIYAWEHFDSLTLVSNSSLSSYQPTSAMTAYLKSADMSNYVTKAQYDALYSALTALSGKYNTITANGYTLSAGNGLSLYTNSATKVTTISVM